MAVRVVGHVVHTDPVMTLRDADNLGSQLRTSISMLGQSSPSLCLGMPLGRRAIASLPGGESLPGTIILLWGGIYALALAALHAPHTNAGHRLLGWRST